MNIDVHLSLIAALEIFITNFSFLDSGDRGEIVVSCSLVSLQMDDQQTLHLVSVSEKALLDDSWNGDSAKSIHDSFMKKSLTFEGSCIAAYPSRRSASSLALSTPEK
ncbi:hypothetical protein F1559_004197 [Cyanidiococcus yangmingshanensis]|uniref:Uncharacterized protein n=1 Tax=Cyanidiococcus yangmingshanensis TaxID=2690220 RepID=A0A7J7IJA7_9RHOD|nr:hypothetical protein F1559_004197 [Cyanidiococcus yangmingshanensis]